MKGSDLIYGVIHRMNARSLTSSLESAIRWRNLSNKLTVPHIKKEARDKMHNAALRYKYFLYQL
jgi:hypothetical protein